MLDAVTSGITSVLAWIGSFITALVGENGQLAELLPLFAIGIAISAILLGKPKSCPLLSNSVKLSRRQYRAKPRWESVETRREHALCARYSPILLATVS